MIDLPERVEVEIETWRSEARDGYIKLQFSKGRIVNMFPDPSVPVQEDIAAVAFTSVDADPVPCPRDAAHGPMRDQDYGRWKQCFTCGARVRRAATPGAEWELLP